MREKQFYNFKVSLYSWQRGANPLFYEDSLYCLHPLFHILSTPSPTSLLSPAPPPLFFLLSSFLALVSEGPWCVFYATRSQVYWGLTDNVVFYWYSDFISHTHKHTNTAHSGASRLAFLSKYILTQPVMCSQQLLLLH